MLCVPGGGVVTWCVVGFTLMGLLLVVVVGQFMQRKEEQLRRDAIVKQAEEVLERSRWVVRKQKGPQYVDMDTHTHTHTHTHTSSSVVVGVRVLKRQTHTVSWIPTHFSRVHA